MRWFRRRAKPTADARSPEPTPTPEPTPVPTPLASTPEEAGLTPRQAEILDFGWEVMKSQGHPHIFLWLAADGWEGGHEIRAYPHGPGSIAVRIKPWEALVLPPNTLTN